MAEEEVCADIEGRVAILVGALVVVVLPQANEEVLEEDEEITL